MQIKMLKDIQKCLIMFLLFCHNHMQRRFWCRWFLFCIPSDTKIPNQEFPTSVLFHYAQRISNFC